MTIPTYIQKILEKKDPTVKTLAINSGIVDEDIPGLVEALNDNPYITYLDLSYNNLGNKSSESLSKLKYIKKLNLSRNNFSDDGVYPIVNLASITHLDISSNNISNKGARIIASTAKQVYLNIDGNYEIDENNLASVKARISANINLQPNHTPNLFLHFTNAPVQKVPHEMENELKLKANEFYEGTMKHLNIEETSMLIKMLANHCGLTITIENLKDEKKSPPNY